MSRAGKGVPVWHLAVTTGEFEQVFWRAPFSLVRWSIGHQRMLTTLCPKNQNWPDLPRIAK
jgi:hypothetical protein